jgi:KaiC/GvpD/RAD55 family RecA-like ATPase
MSDTFDATWGEDEWPEEKPSNGRHLERLGYTVVDPRYSAERIERELTDEETKFLDGIAPPVADKPIPRFLRCPDLVATILDRSKEPTVKLTIGGVPLVESRLGSIIVVTGAPGSGKTTLVVTAGAEHVKAGGVVVFLSIELDADELTARIVGIQCEASWFDVLRGKVSREDMERVLDMPRFAIIEGDDATLANLENVIEALQAEFPGLPILVIADYIQIVPAEDREIRARVAGVVQALRRLAKRTRAVMLAISQPSRAAGNALRSGELMGADTMSTGAESAEIERAAYLTLSLGGHGPEREDGTSHVDLSIGKSRMGQGDRVVPMTYCGRTGVWTIAGEARPATEVRAERDQKRSDQKSTNAAHVILGVLGGKAEPVHTGTLYSEVRGERGVFYGALRLLRDDGRVVRVRGKKKGGQWPLMTADNATKHGIDVVPESVE